jgi:hypothetical protein
MMEKWEYPSKRAGMLDIFISETPITVGRDADGKVVKQDRTPPRWNFTGDDESYAQ